VDYALGDRHDLIAPTGQSRDDDFTVTDRRRSIGGTVNRYQLPRNETNNRYDHI